MTSLTSESLLPRLGAATAPERAPEMDGVTAPRALAPKRTSRAMVALPILVAVGIGVGTTAYWLGLGKQTTNDAQVEGHVASVAPRVSGQVQEVLVKDNQAVQAGDVLVVLDDRELSAKHAAARADLAAAVAGQHAAETELTITEQAARSNLAIAKGGLAQAAAVQGTTAASIERARADVDAAESKKRLAQLELSRSEQLTATGALAQSELDLKRTAFEQAASALQQARAQQQSALANISNSSGTIVSARGRLIAAESGPAQVEAAQAQVELSKARVAQARAALDQAELNLSYTRIRAGVSGVVARRSVEIGQLASPERPLMALVPLDDSWIVANFKEDQIAEISAGQTARVHIDSYDQELTGQVDSLAGGTGSRFSLLPPDNASGNFTKVVQRVPVLIKLDPHPDFTLRPGMSATATVYTK